MHEKVRAGLRQLFKSRNYARADLFAQNGRISSPSYFRAGHTEINFYLILFGNALFSRTMYGRGFHMYSKTCSYGRSFCKSFWFHHPKGARRTVECRSINFYTLEPMSLGRSKAALHKDLTRAFSNSGTAPDLSNINQACSYGREEGIKEATCYMFVVFTVL